jgi:hypothetical protein
MSQVLALLTAAAIGLGMIFQNTDHPHGRAAMVMGFDQQASTHHFRLYDDGGAIEVAANDPADSKNRDAIRSHLSHIAAMFSSGDFEAPMLVHDSTHVPGTAVMAERRDRIRYTYVDTTNGGRVEIVTTDPHALAAVHAFLAYQIAEHKTGDAITVSKR